MIKQPFPLSEPCLDIFHHIRKMEEGSSAENRSNKDIFFILELYKHTREPEILASLLSLIKRQELSTPAARRNQRPCYGRYGLSSLYLDLFKVTGRDLFLGKAMQLGKQYLDPGSPLCGTLDNFGLGDGMSGTMLLHLSLYTETGESWLIDRIRKCLSFFIDRANLTSSGIYWNAVKRSRRHTGWEQGNSGISFCFFELGRFFGDKDWYRLAGKVLTEEDEYIRKERGGVILPAHALTRLYASLLDKDSEYKDYWDDWAASFSLSPPKDSPLMSLPDNGMAFKEAYCLTRNKDYLDIAETVAEEITANIMQGRRKPVEGSGYSDALASAGYFLLKMADPAGDPSLMLPRLSIDRPEGGYSCHSLPYEEPPCRLQYVINEKLLSKHFRKTFSFVKRNHPAELNAFLSSPLFILPEQYEAWIGERIKNQLSGDTRDKLQEAMEIEMVLTRMRNHPGKYILGDTIEFSATMDKLLKLSAEEFLNLKLTVSDKILFLKMEPVFDFGNPLTPSMLSELFTSYGRHSYFFWGDDYMDFRAENLGTSRIFTDLFVKPQPVYKVLNQVIGFILSQEEKTIGVLAEKFSGKSRNHLQMMLNFVLEAYIKSLLMKGVLVLYTASTTSVSAYPTQVSTNPSC